MTLNITVVAPWGIWQCADARLANFDTGEIVDDYSMKHVTIRCRDGAFLITYAGIGRFQGVSVSEWLRKVVRGKSLTVDETLILIRERATQWMGEPAKAKGYHHIFSIGAFLGGQAWAVAIANLEAKREWRTVPPQGSFQTSVHRVEQEPVILAAGIREAVSHEDRRFLREISGEAPDRPDEIANLLKQINERAAASNRSGGLISPRCVTVYMPPKGEPASIRHWGFGNRRSESVVPYMFLGIDVTESLGLLGEMLEDSIAGMPDEEFHAKWDQRVREVAERSVRPE